MKRLNPILMHTKTLMRWGLDKAWIHPHCTRCVDISKPWLLSKMGKKVRFQPWTLSQRATHKQQNENLKKKLKSSTDTRGSTKWLWRASVSSRNSSWQKQLSIKFSTLHSCRGSVRIETWQLSISPRQSQDRLSWPLTPVTMTVTRMMSMRTRTSSTLSFLRASFNHRGTRSSSSVKLWLDRKSFASWRTSGGSKEILKPSNVASKPKKTKLKKLSKRSDT